MEDIAIYKKARSGKVFHMKLGVICAVLAFARYIPPPFPLAPPLIMGDNGCAFMD